MTVRMLVTVHKIEHGEDYKLGVFLSQYSAQSLKSYPPIPYTAPPLSRPAARVLFSMRRVISAESDYRHSKTITQSLRGARRRGNPDMGGLARPAPCCGTKGWIAALRSQ
jgi:hypothetical protein